MQKTLLIIGGGGLVAVAGVLTRYDPNYVALLWPLLAALGGGVYVSQRPDLLPSVVRGLLGSPAPALPAHAAPSADDPATVARAAASDARAEAASRAAAQDVLAALLRAPARTPPRAPLITPPPVRSSAPPEPEPVARPARPPAPTLPPVQFLPDMDRRWLAQYLPNVDPAHLGPIGARPLAEDAASILRMLLNGGVTVQRAMLGTSAATAQRADAWSVLLVIAPHAPEEPICRAIRTRIAWLRAVPYARGGTAILVVLAAPLPVLDAPVLGTLLAALHAETRAPEEDESDAGAPTLADAADVPPGTGEPEADEPEEDEFAAAPAPVPVRPPLLTPPPTRRDEPAIDHFVPPPTAPTLTASGHLATPSAAALERFAHAVPIWQPGERLPVVHFGMGADGALVSGPLELTCIFAPSQRGKTSLVVFLLRQLLLAMHPQTGHSLVPWFTTTKFEERNSFGVSVGHMLRQAYNVRKLDAPRGIEPDGSGAYRVLLLLEQHLRQRLDRALVDPDVQHAPMAVLVDEWTNTARQLKRMRLARDADGTAPTVIAGLGNGSQLVEDMGDDPLAHVTGAVDSLVRQGLGMLMPLILITQDGLVKNTGLDTGLMGSFSTYIGHTELDAGTLRIIAKGDAGKLAAINALKQRHSGWFYAREGQIVPFWMPWVTNDLIDVWLRDLPDAAQPRAAARPVAAAPIVAPVAAAPAPADWPENVRSLVAALDDRLPVLVAAFGKLDIAPPLLGVSGVQRRAMLGIAQPNDPPHLTGFDIRLVRYLAKLRAHGITSNTLAAVLFGRTGQAAQDMSTAIMRHAQ